MRIAYVVALLSALLATQALALGLTSATDPNTGLSRGVTPSGATEGASVSNSSIGWRIEICAPETCSITGGDVVPFATVDGTSWAAIGGMVQSGITSYGATCWSSPDFASSVKTGRVASTWLGVTLSPGCSSSVIRVRYLLWYNNTP